MKQATILSATLAVMAAGHSTCAFAPSAFTNPQRQALHIQNRMSDNNDNTLRAVALGNQDFDETPYFLEPKQEANKPAQISEKKQSPVKSRPKKGGENSDGVFAPVVLLAKNVLGEEKLNQVRAKAISLHSETIGNFVDTAETATGRAALKALFQVADKNGNGVVEPEELAEALQALGFEWLQEKQVQGILKRADSDENGAIDMEEWMREAPKTLRTNLIKLAKKNGGRLGFLA